MTSPSRISLPAVPHGAKVVPVQCVPPSCTDRGPKSSQFNIGLLDAASNAKRIKIQVTL